MAQDNGSSSAPAAHDTTNQPTRLKIIAGTDDFGCKLKDALVSHLCTILGVEVEDISMRKYYTVGEQIGCHVSQASTDSAPGAPEIRDLVACGTGVGVSIFANKFPQVYAATCKSVTEAVNTHSINGCNVLAIGGLATTPG